MQSGWRVARYDEMASAWGGVDWETIQARMEEQDPAALARWEQAAIVGGVPRLAYSPPSWAPDWRPPA